ncbi:MAG TPA: monovalent cation:proton antiporter-2 (CPA2) family protein [Hyphomicrobiaceae bacterium]|nr:monovalent cation:proton antiporter-2 (CPA2) family protein [Hyphomicrobiaceae bacterium]
MMDVSFEQVAWLLAATAFAAPLAKLLRIGSVLGYLLAGVLIGPYGVGQVFSNYKAKEVLEFAEFGVVLLLFLIGLELRPTRVWSMRSAIVGLGGLQVLLTAVLLAAVGMVLGLGLAAAAFAALALSLSSTAFALQVLEEKGELTARHGRLAFAVLLFQDLAAIPLIAFAPLFAVAAATAAPHAQMSLWSALVALLAIAGVVVVGHFLLDHVFRLIARARVREAMTAAALLTVVGTSVVMQQVGISASLGAFLAGALLAESSYRHQLQADIEPFEGLLLGLFFTAVGMQLNLDLLLSHTDLVVGLVVLLLSVKAAVLYGLGRWHGLDDWQARRFAISISQGGEFAFVLFTAGVGAGALAAGDGELLAIVVTLSMAATPLLLLVDEVALPRRAGVAAAFAAPPAETGHVIIAGFGRFGQIVARILRAKRIPFTALDINPEQIAFVERFGSKAFYGDASRPEVIDAAQAGKARAFVLAIDDVEASLRAARYVRARYPKLPIYARARNRNHVHRLMDLGITVIRRETFLSALDLTREVLRGLGISERDVQFAVETFARHDRRRLREDYKHYTDQQKLEELARSDSATLERLFDEDAAEQARIAAAGEQSVPVRAKKELTA